MTASSGGLAAMYRVLWQHRGLIHELGKRDIHSRYRGSVLGMFWILATPLLMLGVYTFVFTQVFKARWPGTAPDNELFFALNLFAGLIVFNFFSETIQRAPGAILGNANFVTKIRFPLAIIPLSHLLASLFHAVFSLSVLFVATLLTTGKLPITLFFFPLIFLPLILFTAGTAWLLAALGVYWRDIGQVVSISLTGLLFLSPVFFPLEAIPARWRFIAHANPLTYPIEQLRAVALHGQLPIWSGWLLVLVASLIWASLGLYIFNRLRRGFADVL